MSDEFTPDFDLYKGKSIAEMMEIVGRAFYDLKINFPTPGVHSQVSNDDVDNLCEQFRKWAEDPELPVAVNASEGKGKQMRKHLYEIGTLLKAANDIYINRTGTSFNVLADQFLNEVDSHLRDLHQHTADAKKKKQST